MLTLLLPKLRRPLRVLCLGAHSDDLEVGCGATVLNLLRSPAALDVTWVVCSATGARASEARRSAGMILKRAHRAQLHLLETPDGHFPAHFADLKSCFERLKSVRPDLVLTHRLEDRHQDHRTVAEVTWQTFRDQLVLEYEIPKYEGDLGAPNLYVPIPAALAHRKVEHLMRHFGTQRSRDWFRRETFYGLLHTRAVECRARSGFAEAFHMRKAIGLHIGKAR